MRQIHLKRLDVMNKIYIFKNKKAEWLLSFLLKISSHLTSLFPLVWKAIPVFHYNRKSISIRCFSQEFSQLWTVWAKHLNKCLTESQEYPPRPWDRQTFYFGLILSHMYYQSPIVEGIPPLCSNTLVGSKQSSHMAPAS